MQLVPTRFVGTEKGRLVKKPKKKQQQKNGNCAFSFLFLNTLTKIRGNAFWSEPVLFSPCSIF